MADAQKQSGAATLTTKEVAEALGTEPKKLRVFLRSDASPMEAVGAGKRYEFTKKDLPKLKKAFTAWAAADTKRRDDRKARIEAERAAKVDDSTPADEDPDLSDVEEVNPAAELIPDTATPRELDMSDEDDDQEAATA